MKTKILELILGIIALVSMSTLAIQLAKASTFMLPSVYLTVIVIAALSVGSLIIAIIVKLSLNRGSFFATLCIIISIASVILIFKFYSPKLTVVIPDGYVGKITLVLSNVHKDILKVDSNGIGYITKWTFDRTYTKPIVLEANGTNVSDQCVGFNPSTFWAKGTFSVSNTTNRNVEKVDIYSLSFEIVPKDKLGQKQYYNVDLIKLVDKAKLYKNE